MATTTFGRKPRSSSTSTTASGAPAPEEKVLMHQTLDIKLHQTFEASRRYSNTSIYREAREAQQGAPRDTIPPQQRKHVHQGCHQR